MAEIGYIIKVNEHQFIEIYEEGNIITLSIGTGNGEIITAGQQRKMRTATMDRATAKLVGEKLLEMAKRGG